MLELALTRRQSPINFYTIITKLNFPVTCNTYKKLDLPDLVNLAHHSEAAKSWSPSLPYANYIGNKYIANHVFVKCNCMSCLYICNNCGVYSYLYCNLLTMSCLLEILGSVTCMFFTTINK